MNPRVTWFGRMLFAVSPVLFGAALLAPAASKQTNLSPAKDGRSTVVSNAAPAAMEIPQSVFLVPTNEQQGKDPFFPRSKRVYAIVSTPVATNRVSAPVELRINGTSGSVESPLVIINNVTFGVGDTREVSAGGRKIKVQCLEIDLAAGTAIIQAGNERRILRFRKLDN